MTQKPKRPPSVWISQVVLGLYLVLLAVVFLGGLFGFVASGGAVVSIVAVVFPLGFIAVFALAFFGLAIRSSWGRWLTLVLFLLMLLGGIFGQFRALTDPRGYAVPVNSAEWFGYLLGGLIFIVPFSFLIYRLGFGTAASNFFNPPEQPEAMSEPPPPPDFRD